MQRVGDSLRSARRSVPFGLPHCRNPPSRVEIFSSQFPRGVPGLGPMSTDARFLSEAQLQAAKAYHRETVRRGPRMPG